MKKETPSQFSKFANKRSNASIKEQFKQEKRKAKKEKEAYFEQKRKEQKASFTRETFNNKSPNEKIAKAPTIQRKTSDTDSMPLNKFLAHAGICGRREAADLVKEGLVKVNNEVVTSPGHKVTATDEVKFKNKRIHVTKNLIYILLNKPKDYLTTTDDPQKRKTVLDLIQRATTERVYPVGRLDRNTSGVLLLTNDGELAQKLTHPKHEVRKIYAVTLDKVLEKGHFDAILRGLVLEDGPVNVDVLAYTDVKDKTKIGVEIHSGRNRIVRRIFESLGYDVKNLDRVSFAGLTKKNVERGKWRFLTEREVRDLKHFSKGKK